MKHYSLSEVSISSFTFVATNLLDFYTVVKINKMMDKDINSNFSRQ